MEISKKQIINLVNTTKLNLGKKMQNLERKDFLIIIREIYLKLGSNSYRKCIFNQGKCDQLIRSHTLQNARGIDKISYNGHVGMFSVVNSEINISLKIPRSKATTFLGMCNHHDTEIFRAIDLNKDQKFDFSDTNKLNLLAYRGVLKEYFEKLNIQDIYHIFIEIIETRNLKRLHNFLPYTKKFKVSFPFEQINIELMHSFLLGTALGLSDLETIKEGFEKSIFNGENLIDHDVIVFDKTVDFALSSICTPNTFFDNTLTVNNMTNNGTDLEDPMLWSNMCVNIFPEDNSTVIIFSYLKTDQSLRKFYKDLISVTDIEEKQKLLSYFILYNISNMIFNPQTFNLMDNNIQKNIVDIFKSTIAKDKQYPEEKVINLFDLLAS